MTPLLLGASLLLSALPLPGAPPPRPAPDRALEAPARRLEPSIANTAQGTFRGEVVAGDVVAFRGLRYAAPPTGDLRWRPPVSPLAHKGTAEATEFGHPCLQFEPDGPLFGSEDCLTLNVWKPAARATGSGRPVLFFIHGGGNVQGASDNPVYDGQHLARRAGAVVVTVNYRLNALGYLAHPFLDLESARSVSGNYGILDLVAALTWVKTNARAFDGDPARILVFGESAGAVNTCALVASPLARGLFSAALMQSGGCTQPTLSRVEEFGETIVTAAGCASSSISAVAACMRGLSAEAVVAAVPGAANVVSSSGQLYGPAVDGWVLPASPEDALRAGTHNHVAFAVGANADETGMAAPLLPTAGAYEAAVLAQFGLFLGPLVLREYPAADFATPRQAYIAVTTDARFVCPSRRIARAAAAGQAEPVYRYFFTHVLDSSLSRIYGAFHGLELPFVFGTLTDIDGFTPSASELALSAAMGDAWVDLAAGRAPAAGTVAWPLYDPVTDPYLRLGNGVGTGTGVRTERCDFWDGLLALLP